MNDFTGLTTEERSEYVDLDQMSTLEMVQTINKEDAKVAAAVREQLPQIAAVIDMIVPRLKQGGRLFYVGAGTSGRLGVLDASECPPTFGVPSSLVQGIIAGGDEALRNSLEGCEDNAALGAQDLAERGCGSRDTVIAIAASGRTPYCIGALEYARQVGAVTAALVCNPDSPMAQVAQMAIVPVVGPEVLSGSTRMKAGTAQKMVLNMISTVTMVHLGKVYSNLMIDVVPANEKLLARAERIVQIATGTDAQTAQQLLAECGGQVKTAIVAYSAEVTPQQSAQLLEKAGGFVRKAIALAQQ
ncbi:MAG TPA: N-acetylmuramic acid 6-phosphate etherase [Firmicutes bacterium]|nr:N-acetylmuramic acid 6-phosphate etherase [Bacillota bacterium]